MKTRPHLPASVIALLAFVSSLPGIVNQFTYDDEYIIKLNGAVHSLHRWWMLFGQSYWPKDWSGDGYRPLTMLGFSLEWFVGRGSPMVFHAVNILLYVATALLVFELAKMLLPLWAAWCAAALFAVHPVHVEAVANIVGQAELTTALAVVAATLLYVRDRRAGDLRPRTAALVTVLYAVACLAKEHGIVLPAILLAAELTLIDDPRPAAERARHLRATYFALFAVAVAFVGVRARVLSDHSFGGFAPYTPFSSLRISAADRILSALGVVPEWLRLLLWPVHLSSEYGPPGLDIAQSVSVVQLPGIILLAAVAAFAVLLRRRQPVASFGIAVTAIALLPSSNFILAAGIMLAERTLFLPSVGAMLAVGGFAVMARDHLVKSGDARAPARAGRWGIIAVALLLVAGAAESGLRARVWRNNEVLFRQAVIDSPSSYRAHFMLGAYDFEHKRKVEGESEYLRAMKLFPFDPAVSYSLAEQYRLANMCKAAIPYYRWTREVAPDYPSGRTPYAICFLEIAQYDSAQVWLSAALKAGGDARLLHQLLVSADSGKRAESVRASVAGPPGGAVSKVPETVQKAAR